MSLKVRYIIAFIFAFVLSTLIVPFVKRIGWKYNIYALENERTVHHGKIVRIGGVAVYISFMIAVLLFYGEMNELLLALMISSSVIFLGGLLDDIFNLKAWQKICFQALGAILYIVIGKIELNVITLPFNLSINLGFLGYVFTFFWIIGITNAINLIDGLDGLSSGFSIIILITICIINYFVDLHAGVLLICMILVGAISGFLIYNFNPASIFIGDCGAQYMGFMIAAISIKGYKSGTAITMMLPLILLFIPIMDVFSAILRRKLSGKKFSDSDKGHFHHQLLKLFKTNQRNTVLFIYFITILFGATAYIYAVNQIAGIIILFILFVAYDIFAEATGMISTKYHPILSILSKIKRLTEK